MVTQATEGDPVELVDFDSLWNFSDPAATETAFRELLPAALESGDETYHLSLLTQIARTQGLQRSFDDAHAILDDVEKALETAKPVARVRYLLERGRVFNSSKKPEKSHPLFLGAWELAKTIGKDGFAVDAAHMMAIIEKDEKALEWNETALAFAEASEDERARKWLGSLYNNIGWTYHDMSRFDDALTLFEKALYWQEEKGDLESIQIAKWCVGRGLRSLDRIEEALAIQLALLAEFEAAGAKDGYVFEELAECYLIIERHAEAKSYFALAHAELSQDPWLMDNEPDRIARLKELGGVDD